MAKVRPAAKRQDNLNGEKLVLHTEEDRVAEDKRDGNKWGRTTGLNITHFTNELFMQNYDRNLGDDELEAILKDEFPNRGVIQKVSAYRGYFNGGVHGFGPYCNAEGGSRPCPPEERLPRYLSAAEQDAKEAKVREKDEAKAAAKAEREKARAAAKAKSDAEKAKVKAEQDKLAAKSGKGTPPAAKGAAKAPVAGKVPAPVGRAPAGKPAAAPVARRPAVARA